MQKSLLSEISYFMLVIIKTAFDKYNFDSPLFYFAEFKKPAFFKNFS